MGRETRELQMRRTTAKFPDKILMRWSVCQEQRNIFGQGWAAIGSQGRDIKLGKAIETGLKYLNREKFRVQF